MKITLGRPCYIEYKRYGPGDSVDVPEELAEALRLGGYLASAPEPAPERASEAVTEPPPETASFLRGRQRNRR